MRLGRSAPWGKEARLSKSFGTGPRKKYLEMERRKEYFIKYVPEPHWQSNAFEGDITAMTIVKQNELK